MSSTHFSFRQFTVWHDKCAMKVGTDGVLLGAWATVDAVSHTLDIGTGTGLIAMMIAQRNRQVLVDAIDIDRQACEQAKENVEKSPFRDRIHVIHQSFTDYITEKKYDLIISNPPFFTNALKSPDPQRNMARHNDSLPLKALIEHAMTMLSENGRLAFILPTFLSAELDFIIATHRLYQIRRTEIVSMEGVRPKRFLTEIMLHTGMVAVTKTTINTGANTLILKTQNQQRTESYKELTRDFYLENH